jgi:L-lactate dehydrogenase complex protein LldG
MSSRNEILERIRRNQPQPRSQPAVPAFGPPMSSAVESFRAALTRMGGKLAETPADGQLDVLVTRLFPDAKVVCSATPEVKGNRPISGVKRQSELADVDVGVVRAAFGVSETGSVWLTEREFKVSALGFLSQHLVVLLDPVRIVGNMHDAYRQRAQFDASYGVFMTGPSATADIEGVLIHGAQGIRTLTVVLTAARRADGSL